MSAGSREPPEAGSLPTQFYCSASRSYLLPTGPSKVLHRLGESHIQGVGDQRMTD